MLTRRSPFIRRYEVAWAVRKKESHKG